MVPDKIKSIVFLNKKEKRLSRAYPERGGLLRPEEVRNLRCRPRLFYPLKESFFEARDERTGPSAFWR
jgi:hypothetical protein